jgi:hypothetical protein
LVTLQKSLVFSRAWGGDTNIAGIPTHPGVGFARSKKEASGRKRTEAPGDIQEVASNIRGNNIRGGNLAVGKER